jgi:hypothetical protein
MGTKKKRVHINLVGSSGPGKTGGTKGRKGGRKGGGGGTGGGRIPPGKGK